MVAFLEKPAECDGFEQIVNFLNAYTIKHALTVNPTIYSLCIEQFWATAKAKIVNGEEQLQALVERKKIYVTPSHIKKVFGNMKRVGKGFSRNITPLFPTMMVQAQEEMGEGSANPTDPHHTPTIEEDVNVEHVPTHSNDPLLSGEDSMQLKELMEFCTQLQQRVLDLENTNTAQAQEITCLKKRLNKLERRKKSRTHRRKRLYKVGMSARIESSDDKASLGDQEDASKQGRKIHDIDAAKDIYLVNVHRDEGMFGVNDLDGDEVFVETKEPVVNAATTTSTILVSAVIDLSDIDMTLAQALTELKNAKPKAVTIAATTTTPAITRPMAKGLVIQEQKQASTPITSSKDKGKGIMVEEPLKMKKKDHDNVETDYELAQRLQAKEQEELTIEENMDTELVEGSEVRAEGKSEELKKCLEIVLDDGDDVTIDATPLSTKSPTIVDYKIHQEGKKSYFQIIKADGNSQMYLTFPKMLKNFKREDLEVLWRKVKTRFKKTKLVNYMDSFLLLNLKTMFEHYLEDMIWKNQQGLVKVMNWKLFDSCRVHFVTVQSIPYYLLVEKMYPLTKHTLHQMFNDMKLQVDYECEMTYELLRLDLALYENESWNDPRDFAKPVKAISLPEDVSMNEITSSCEIYSGPHDTHYCMENPKQAFVGYASLRTNEAGDRMTGALPSNTVKNSKMNVNSTSPVLSACSYPTDDLQCSTHIHGSINAITIHPKQQGNSHDDNPEEDKQ
ncbi:hypothetical protein Tco_1485808 [Tanacetum coccineum]